MKNRIVGIVGILLLMAGAAVASAETGSVTVSGGVLSVTAANVTLTGVTLDGTDQTTTSTSNAWTTEDSRGTGAGWNLTVASTDYTTDTVQRVDIGSLQRRHLHHDLRRPDDSRDRLRRDRSDSGD